MAKDTFARKKIAIIGGGHIGIALARGLINEGVRESRLIVSDPTPNRLKSMGIKITTDNASAARHSDLIFLAVKPAIVTKVVGEIGHLLESKLVISLAAGVTVTELRKGIRSRCAIARIMPNIAIAYSQGVMGLFAPKISDREKTNLRKMLQGLGLLVEVKKEKDLDALTLVSGCGPAIVSSFIALLAKEAQKRGFVAASAEALALQTFKGTLAYLEKSDMSPKELIASVATKGGVTEAILKQLTREGFEKRFARATQSGYRKIKNIRA